jgi:two-component system chemotaxis response regulator CheB
MRPIRVLVVDDSVTMRRLIRSELSRDPDVKVVGESGDAHEARAAIKSLNPDVITLDVEMPRMNGLDFLDKIMRLRPTPVIMVSSQTSRGAAAAIKALEIGAVDCIAKPCGADKESFGSLTAKVKAAADVRFRSRARSGETAEERAPDLAGARVASSRPYRPDGRILAIGASTGGVEALVAVLSKFPANCPPTLITQHMPATFTKSFAARLDRLCKPKVREAEDGAVLETGQIYLAPGGLAHLELQSSTPFCCRLRQGDPINGHRPSVDALFHSVASAAGAKALGVILTGMGRDGAEGLLAMRRAGAMTLGQDESSCLIFGMPKAAFELGAVEKQVPLNRMAAEILRMTCIDLEGDTRCRSHQP